MLIGVIGHVDHGKTSLVGALTGMDTDRLTEEKQRGISIALGFAHCLLPDGRRASFIDMPGHERFVRTMIGGAGGIDAVLLCVAADEGVMPQTREHVQVAALLGVRRAVVAVTRADRAPDGVAGAGAGARALLRANGLEAPQPLATVAPEGAGVTGIAAALAALPDRAVESLGWSLLPVDRAFSVAGFGTVVTGTLRHGSLSVGARLEVHPGARPAEVRGLHVHGEPVATAMPGGRVAVNLRHVAAGDVRRGDTLASPGMVRPSRWLDVRVTLLPDAPAPLQGGGEEVRLLWGTSEVATRLRLLDRMELHPGGTAVAQVKPAVPVALAAAERFVLRRASPPLTIGGGVVLDPVSRRQRRDAATAAGLARLNAPPAERATAAVDLAGWRGRTRADLRIVSGLPDAGLPLIAAEVFGDLMVAARAAAEMRAVVLETLLSFHRRHPAQPGLPPARLAALLPQRPPSAVLDGVLAALVAEGVVERSGAVVRRADVDPLSFLPERDRLLVDAMASEVRAGGLRPPDVPALVGGSGARRNALLLLIRRGDIVRTVDRVQKREVLFHREAVARAGRILSRSLSGPFTAGEAGRTLGTTRKYVIPLLEYLDARGITRRDGDHRTVARKEVPAE